MMPQRAARTKSYTLCHQAGVMQKIDPGSAYTAADGGPFVGTLDVTSGIITPVVTGLRNPGGLIFVDTSDQDSEHGGFRRQSDHDDDQCHGSMDAR